MNRLQKTETLTKRAQSSKKRFSAGHSLVEICVGACIIIPLAFFFLDAAVLILANTINDTAVKNAARAAANQPDGGQAFQAAQASLNSIKSSSIVKSISLVKFDYPASKEAVTCETRMEVKLPIPFPGNKELVFIARAVEPIVGAK